MKPISLAILILLAFLTITHGQTDFQAVKAIAHVESSHRVHVQGDNGKAYGLYQFHLARWIECGGTKENFKNASEHTQTQVMLREIAIVRKIAQRKNVDFIQALGTYHNIGHVSKTETAYVKKLRKALNCSCVH